MDSERVDLYWRRPRGIRRVHVVAVLCALLAAASVIGLFNQFGPWDDAVKSERQLIASVDLRIGNPEGAAERGAAVARKDIEAGLLQLQVFGPDAPPTAAEAAQARRWKQRHDIGWVRKGNEPTLLTLAFARAYNRVMQAEIERRHGPEVLERLLREQRRALPTELE